MTEDRVPCPRCGQDWLREIWFVHLGGTAAHCEECDAIWLAGVAISKTTFSDRGTYLMAYGRPPDAPGEFETRGFWLVN